MKIKVLLADDHKMVREALRMLLETDPEIEVVAEVGDGGEVLRRVKETHPAVVCMDVGLPGLNGIDATRRLRTVCPEVKVIGVSAHLDEKFVFEMLDAGAAGYVAKSDDGSALLKAIHAVMRNQTYLCPEVSGGLVDRLRGQASHAEPLPAASLTSREREVLQLLAEGNSTPRIAERLFLSPATVDVHRRNIMRKLDIHNVAALTHYAIRVGLSAV